MFCLRKHEKKKLKVINRKCVCLPKLFGLGNPTRLDISLGCSFGEICEVMFEMEKGVSGCGL